MDLIFRPAKPSDVDDAIPLIYSSAENFFDYMFKVRNKTALDFLRYAFLEGSGHFGYKVQTVVEYQSRVVGSGAFSSGPEYKRLNMGTGKQIEDRSD